MNFITFNPKLLKDLEGKEVEELSKLAPEATLELFLSFRAMRVEDGKFVLTEIGKSLVEFDDKQV